MASVHSVISKVFVQTFIAFIGSQSYDIHTFIFLQFQIPEDLDFENILICATEMYKEYPLLEIKDEVDNKIAHE